MVLTLDLPSQDRLDYAALKGDAIDLRSVAMHFKGIYEAGGSMWMRSLNAFVRDLSCSELKSLFYQYNNDPLHQSYVSSKTCANDASDDKWSELEGFIQWLVLDNVNNQSLLATGGQPGAVPADTRSPSNHPKIQEPQACSVDKEQTPPEHSDDVVMSVASDDERVPTVSDTDRHVNAAELDSDYEADDGHKYPPPPDASFPNINRILDSAVEASITGWLNL